MGTNRSAVPVHHSVCVERGKVARHQAALVALVGHGQAGVVPLTWKVPTATGLPSSCVSCTDTQNGPCRRSPNEPWRPLPTWVMVRQTYGPIHSMIEAFRMKKGW